HPGANVVANINPFSTLAVAAAKRMTGGLTAGNLASALQSVVTEFNSGLPPLAAFNPMTTPVDDKNVAMVVKASEALAEVLRRTHQSAAAARPELSVDDVVEALASDLVDGVLDGQGAEG